MIRSNSCGLWHAQNTQYHLLTLKYTWVMIFSNLKFFCSRRTQKPPSGGRGGTGFSDRCDLINGCWVVWATCWDSLDTTEVKNWANIRQYKVNISKISLLALFVDNYPMRWACSFHTDFLWRRSASNQTIVPYWYHFWDAPRAQDELMTLK